MTTELFIKCFALLTSFEFFVPWNYNHDTQLTTFAAYRKNNIPCLNPYGNNNMSCHKAIADANYVNAASRLVPGITYNANFFEIKETKGVSIKDCLAFLESQRTIFVGPQGISLVHQLTCQSRKSLFPKNRWIISFDEKDAHFVDAEGRHKVSGMMETSSGFLYFSLHDLENVLPYNYCFLSVCDLPAGGQP